MLNPSQYLNLQRNFQNNSVKSLDGIFFDEVKNLNPDFGDSVKIEDKITIDIQKPLSVFGVPAVLSMLSTITDRKVEIPEKIIRKFSNAICIGWRSIVTPNGFYSSAKAWKMNGVENLINSKNDGFCELDGVIHYAAPKNKDRFLIEDPVLFLSYLEPGNYGSFIFRCLPKLLLAIDEGVDFKFILAPDRSPSLIQILNYLNLGHIPVITCRESIGLCFKKLFVIDDFEAEGAVCNNTINRIKKYSPPAGCERKIYVSRLLNNEHRPKYRPLVNEIEIQRVMKNLGFDILNPETIGFQQQQSIFKGASCIVGPSGSGMLNSIFAPDGCKVIDIESFTYTMRQHANVYGSSFKKYAFVLGKFEDDSEPVQLRSWSVNGRLLTEAVDFMLNNN